MTKNTLGHVHNLLIEEMERLMDADSVDLADEVERARAMANLATSVNNNASTILRGQQMQAELGAAMPKMLTGSSQ